MTCNVKDGSQDSGTKFSGLSLGLYLILVTEGTDIYQPSVTNLVPENDNGEYKLETKTVSIKKSTLTIKKTAENTSTKIGDTITYTIIADVPTYGKDAQNTNYYIGDLLGDGLELDPSSIKVYGVTVDGATTSNTLLTENTDYSKNTDNATKPTTNNNSNGEGDNTLSFLLTLVYNQIKDYTQIKVTYTATITDTSPEDSSKLTNKAYLFYSSNQYDTDDKITEVGGDDNIEGTGGEDEDSPTVTIYSYGIEITKVDKSNSSTTLQGAEFTISKGTGNGTSLYFIKTEENGETVYYQCSSSYSNSSKTITTTLTTDSSGKLKIYGLDAGTYTLTETKAPEGYNLPSSETTIEITDADNDGKIDTTDSSGSESAIKTLQITNSKGFQLPETGGLGITIFIATGLVMILVGTSIVIYVRKKSNSITNTK